MLTTNAPPGNSENTIFTTRPLIHHILIWLRCCILIFIHHFISEGVHWQTWMLGHWRKWHWCYHSTAAGTPRRAAAGTWGAPAGSASPGPTYPVWSSWSLDTHWDGLSLFQSSSSWQSSSWRQAASSVADTFSGDHPALGWCRWGPWWWWPGWGHGGKGSARGSLSSAAVWPGAPEPQEGRSHSVEMSWRH